MFYCVSPQKIAHFIKPQNANSIALKELPDVYNSWLEPPLNLPVKTGYLTINVLFCYSPEVLSTYDNLDELIADNNELCSIATAVFTQNSEKYIVYVNNVGNHYMPDLQAGRRCLLDNHLEYILENYQDGYYPDVDRLKILLQANVVVFIPRVCGLWKYLGTSGQIGFSNPREASMVLARGTRATKIKTSLLCPTLLCHEMGHLLGCSHPLLKGEKPKEHLVPGYGHHVNKMQDMEDARNGTIMSYSNTAIWYFSNPNLFRYYAPDMNKPCGKKGVAEAYKVVEANLPKLATSLGV